MIEEVENEFYKKQCLYTIIIMTQIKCIEEKERKQKVAK